MPPRYELGVPVNLVRFSVGLEDISDIISDLDQALRTAVYKTSKQCYKIKNTKTFISMQISP